MRPLHALQVAVLAVGVGLLVFMWSSCESADAPESGGAGMPPAALQTQAQRSTGPPVSLAEVQAAVSAQPGFTLQMLGRGLALPGWGGIVGPSRIEVRTSDGAVRATVTRAGEPEVTYEILHTADEMLYKRSTCDAWSPLPVRGLRMFDGVYGLSEASIAEATLELTESADGYDTFNGEIAGFGPIVLVVDRGSGLPVRMSSDDAARSDGAIFDILFKDWGEAPQVDPPDGAVADREPGAPC